MQKNTLDIVINDPGLSCFPLSTHDIICMLL